MSGTLYLVAVPIGNIDDITPRAKNVLGVVDFIACEDTRVTGQLLTQIGINKKLISYYDKVEDHKSQELVSILESGKSVAVVSDAGSPCISDPGYYVTKNAHEKGIKVISLPGASAVTTALSASGFPAVPYLFVGFLPKKEKAKAETVSVFPDNQAVVFFESPNRIKDTLSCISQIKPDSELFVIRELTKTYEEYYRGKAQDISVTEKGEFTVVFFNKKDSIELDQEIINLVNELKQTTLSSRDIAQVVSTAYKLPKNKIKSLL